MKWSMLPLLLWMTVVSAAAHGAVLVRVESPLNLGDQNKEWCHSDPIDSMVLTVTDGDKPPIVDQFCSSYGGAKAQVASDKKGRMYVLLQYGKGRGTNEADDFLRVYRLETGHLFRIMDIQLSWQTSPVDRFLYDFTVQSLVTDGLEIVLREHPPASGPDVISWPEQECCIPSDRIRKIWIDPEP